MTRFVVIGSGVVGAVVLALVLTGVFTDDLPTEPKPVAEGFVAAVAASDGTEACELLGHKLAAQLDEEALACSTYFESSYPNKTLAAVGSSSIEAVRVRANTATATLSGTRRPLRLALEGDAWRIRCVPGVGHVLC